MTKAKIEEFVKVSLRDVLKENDMYIWDIAYVKEGRDYFLRVYIDNNQFQKYVSIDDCQLVSEVLSTKLDEVDIIDRNYFLEISSAGMDRQLSKPEHFDRCMGKNVDIKLYKAQDGLKEFTAKLSGFDDEIIKVEMEDETERLFQMKDIAAVRLTVIL